MDSGTLPRALYRSVFVVDLLSLFCKKTANLGRFGGITGGAMRLGVAPRVPSMNDSRGDC